MFEIPVTSPAVTPVLTDLQSLPLDQTTAATDFMNDLPLPPDKK